MSAFIDSSEEAITGAVSVTNFPPVQNVRVVGGTTTGINVYSSALVPYATVTTILTYTVTTATLSIFGVFGWGDTSGEFLVKLNGTVVGGGRTTAASPNFYANYEPAAINAVNGDVITITAEHYNIAARTMKANLLGG